VRRSDGNSVTRHELSIRVSGRVSHGPHMRLLFVTLLQIVYAVCAATGRPPSYHFFPEDIALKMWTSLHRVFYNPEARDFYRLTKVPATAFDTHDEGEYAVWVRQANDKWREQQTPWRH
jgi:hypothetical protein